MRGELGLVLNFGLGTGEEHSARRSGNFASDLRRCEIATQPFVFRSEQLTLAFSSFSLSRVFELFQGRRFWQSQPRLGDRVRRGRPGLAGSAPSGLVAVGIPAANSLSRIFVRVGNGLNGPTFTIPDSMPGSLDCAARELQSPGYSVDAITNAMTPQAIDGLRNSSTTVMRRMLASIKSVEEALGGGLLLLRHYHAKNPNQAWWFISY